jgi:hypothetical protein
MGRKFPDLVFLLKITVGRGMPVAEHFILIS